MDTGQMMAVMQQMPARVAVPQVAEATLPSDRVDGAFAGLLQGMSQQKTVQVSVARQEVPPSESGLLNVPEIMRDALSALSSITSNSEMQTIPEQADSAEEETIKTTQQDGTDRESQNVILDLNGAQLALLLDQMSGRMPEAVIPTDSQSGSLLATSQANHVETVQLHNAVTAHIRSDAPEQHVVSTAVKAMPASVEESLRPVIATTVPTRLPVTGMIDGEKKPVSTLPVREVIAAASQNETAVTESDTQAVMKSAEAPRPTVVPPLAAAEKSINQPDGSNVPVRDYLRVVSEPQRRHDPVVARGPEIVIVPEVQALQQPAVDAHDVTEAGEGLQQPEQQVIQNRVATLSPNPAAARLLQVPMQANELSETPELQSGMTGQQESLQELRSATPIVTLTAAAVSEANNGRPDTVTLRPDLREAGKNPQGERVETAKIMAAVPSEGTQAGSNEQETPDRGMNGNFQSLVLHQQVKTEGSSIAGNTAGAVLSDTPRTALPPEQVVQQVRDRLVNHETKPGSEQIVLRLSPEHLGELKVNLSLEGQRLKVEIVAENRMVRDSLMQHTDALKESLSRQNIKMESFEVTTGGNGSAGSGRSQGDWRELAQQRQHNAWMPDGGYRLATQAAPAIAAYQMKSEHTMVDLHF